MGEPLAHVREGMPVNVDERVLAAALTRTAQPITVHDATSPEGVVVYCNQAFCALTGYPPDEIVGRGLSFLAAATDSAQSGLAELLRLAVTERDVELRRCDGCVFCDAMRAAPVTGAAGELTHVVLSHDDITPHRQRDRDLRAALARAERANWAKSRLIAVAGHDLRQPLQTIAGALELLARHTVLSERSRRVLEHAEMAVADLDEELKALAHVADANRDFAPRIEDFPLEEVLEPLFRTWRPRAEHKGLESRVQPTRVWVRSDLTMLRTIVRNLLGNAVKYTARGRVLVGARREPGSIRLEIRDTGPGVSPHMVSRIFDAFERADAPGEGLGLGLWIVRRTADMLGHSVGVQSTYQHGSCFSVRLPRASPL